MVVGPSLFSIEHLIWFVFCLAILLFLIRWIMSRMP